jgi:hypothetical protein
MDIRTMLAQSANRLASTLGRGWPALVVVAALAAGHARGEELQYPVSVAVHSSGAIYLADRNLPGVWRLEGDRSSVYFKGSKKLRTPLNAVRCVAIDGEGNLLAGDSATCDVYRFDAGGVPKPLTAQGKPYGKIGIPMDIALDAEGNLFVSDLETQRIVKVAKGGGAVTPVVSVRGPRGLWHDKQKRLWILSSRKLIRLAPGGEQETLVDEGVFEFPHRVVVQEGDVAYVSDGHGKTIWKIAPGAKPEKWVSGPPLANPVGMDAFKGGLLVTDPAAKAVFEIDAKRNVTRKKMTP